MKQEGFSRFKSILKKRKIDLVYKMIKNKSRTKVRDSVCTINQIALVTLPERIHRVQTYTWRGEPLTIAFTRFTLGFQGRLERR